MRLTWKIALTITLTICAVLGVDGYLRVHRQLALFETDIKRDHLSMGRATAAAMVETWIAHGEDLALDLIERIGKKTKRVKVRWIPSSRSGGAGSTGTEPPEAAEVMRSGQAISVVYPSESGERFVRTYVPITPREAAVGVLEISESLAPQKRYIKATILRSAATTAVMIVICVAATFLLGFALVGRPVKKLVERARSIGKGDFSGRLELQQNDEIADLAEEMNTMAERLHQAMRKIESETTARLETLEQLRHADRLKIVGQLTSGVVHEIGTPLTVISGRAKMISTGEVDGEEARNSARIAVEQTERVTRTIRQILEFARRGEKQKVFEDITQIAGEMVRLLGPVAVKRGIYIDVETGDAEAFLARVDRSQIQQVLANLIVNAIQAARPGGRVIVKVALEDATDPGRPDRDPRACCALSVSDDGEGIPEDVMPRIFEPFYTTKASGDGTGLGLAISREIVREHDGWIGVVSEQGRGSRFTIYLPVERGES